MRIQLLPDEVRKYLNSICKFIEDNIVIFALLSIFTLFFFVSSFSEEIPKFTKGTNAAISTLSVIATALSAILGIFIAILLVGFELLQKTYAYHAIKEVFSTNELKLIFTFYISTIIVSVVSIAIIDDPLSIHNLKLLYFSMFLFLICMIILYPCSRRILTSTRSLKRIEEIIESIDSDTIKELQNPSQSTLSQIQNIERNPIIVLSEISIRTIKDDDRFTPQFILIESKNKLLELLGKYKNSQSNRAIINGFIIIIHHSTSQAIKKRQLIILKTVLNIIKDIHSYCAENKIAWHEVVELNVILQSILERMMDVGLNTMVKQGMWAIDKIFWKHLRLNVPPEKDIWSLHIGKDKKEDISEDDIDKDLQWEHVSTEYISMLYRLTEKAIELKKGDLVYSGLRCLENIATRVTKSTLGNLQKKRIIWECYEDIEQLILRCADQGIYERVPFLSPFEHYDIYKTLEKDAEFSNIPLKSFGETLIQLTKKGIIDTYEFFKLENIGSLIVKRIDDSSRHAEALHFICRVFDEIRCILEKRIDKKEKFGIIERERSIEAYFIIFDYLNLINRLVKNKGESPINREIFSILEKFKKREDF